MKITCDNCGAKYSIADEKIRGKVFKIRCKRCSQAIVVRGESGPSPSGETSAAGARGEPKAASFAGEDLVWHVVVGREQIGPISSNEVRNRIQRGEVSDRTYVWREGFADWQRLADVPELARDLVARPLESAGQAAQEVAAANKAPSGDWNATVGMAQDAASLATEHAPFISAEYQSHDSGHMREETARAVVGGGRAAGGHAGLAAASGTSSDNQDAFLGFSVASAQKGGEDIFAAARRADGGKDGAEHRMTGQRSENSVLFSLDSLQAMATGSSTSPSSGRITPEKDRRSEEGSALIDLRAMAATVAPLRSAPDPADAPTIGGFSGAFSTAVASPAILIPSAGEAQPRWVLPTVIGLAAALIASITVLAIILLHRPVAQVEALGPAASHVAVAAAGPTKGALPGSTTQPATAGTAKPGTAPSETKEAAEREPDHAAAPAKESKPRAHLRATKLSGHHGAAEVPATAAESAAAAEHREPPRAKPRKHDELDDLIDGAMSKKGGGGGQRAVPSGGAAAGAGSDLPTMLSHDQIRAGMQDVNPRVRACFDRFKVPGIANVRVTISGSGRVTATSVSGIFEGTPTGDCVERAARQAHFEPFKKPSMSFTMPFVLR